MPVRSKLAFDSSQRLQNINFSTLRISSVGRAKKNNDFILMLLTSFRLKISVWGQTETKKVRLPGK
jgi:hypothetical protein